MIPVLHALLIVSCSALILAGAIGLHRRSGTARARLQQYTGSTRQAQDLLRRAVTDLRGCLLLGLLAAPTLTLLGAH